jgi:hypothetical protein
MKRESQQLCFFLKLCSLELEFGFTFESTQRSKKSIQNYGVPISCCANWILYDSKQWILVIALSRTESITGDESNVEIETVKQKKRKDDLFNKIK